MQFLVGFLFFTVCVGALQDDIARSFPSDIWIWQCVKGMCSRVRADLGNPGMSLTKCQLTCGPYASLWPHPKEICKAKQNLEKVVKKIQVTNVRDIVVSVNLGYWVSLLKDDVVTFNPHKLVISNSAPSKTVDVLLDGAVDRFIESIFNLKKTWEGNHGLAVKGNVTVLDDDSSIYLDTEESYRLSIKYDNDVVSFDISAMTYFGARHGLETLSQLIAYDPTEDAFLILQRALIFDEPAFKHRGLLLDTSRHFYPVTALERLIDGLAMNKLNTLHWHITDTPSWPIYCPTQPNMTTFGAYSSQEIYYPEDVKRIVQYAKERGVRVLPEIDTPYHVSNGFQWANEVGRGEAVLCLEDYFCGLGLPCGHLNPINPFVLELLHDIYKDLLGIFNTEMFHVGADEVLVECWNRSEAIRTWMEENSLNYTDVNAFYLLWSNFQLEAHNKLVEANKGKQMPAIVWTSDLTSSEDVSNFLDKERFVVQIWTSRDDTTIKDLVSKGYKVIFSNYDAWYLDCGFGSYLGGKSWCDPYKTWRKVYDNNPYDILASHGISCETGNWNKACDLVLGGETCMWGEEVDNSSLDMKVWPRTAALAERLWSNPSTGTGTNIVPCRTTKKV